MTISEADNWFIRIIFTIVLLLFIIAFIENRNEKKELQEKLVNAYMQEFKLSRVEAERKVLIDTNNPTKMIVIDNSRSIVPDNLKVEVK